MTHKVCVKTHGSKSNLCGGLDKMYRRHMRHSWAVALFRLYLGCFCMRHFTEVTSQRSIYHWVEILAHLLATQST